MISLTSINRAPVYNREAKHIGFSAIPEYEFARDMAKLIARNIWGKPLREGVPKWNSQYYLKFRKLDTNMQNRHIADGTIDPNLLKQRDAIFDKLEPLGRDEIHYRGEVYTDAHDHIAKLKELASLKPGDIYEPRINMWFSDSFKYAYRNYATGGLPDWRSVVYKIFCPKEAKIIQIQYGESFTEGVYPRNAKFKVIKNEKKIGFENKEELHLTLDYLA